MYIHISTTETFMLPICLSIIKGIGFITFLSNELQNPIPNCWLSAFAS